MEESLKKNELKNLEDKHINYYVSNKPPPPPELPAVVPPPSNPFDRKPCESAHF